MAKESKKSTVSDRTIYPFRIMNIGEEIFIPDAPPSFRAYVYHRGTVLGRKFTVNKEVRGGVEGLRVERIRA